MIKKLLGRKDVNPSAEMSFIDHLEVLRRHIIRALIGVGIGSIIVFVNIEYVVDRILMGPVHPEFITYQWLCQLGNFLHLPEICLKNFSLKFLSNAMTEQFLMTFTLSFTGGVCTGLPIRILGNLAVCATCTQQQRKKRHHRCHHLGISIILRRCSFRLYCPHPIHGEFLQQLFFKPAH